MPKRYPQREVSADDLALWATTPLHRIASAINWSSIVSIIRKCGIMLSRNQSDRSHRRVEAPNGGDFLRRSF